VTEKPLEVQYNSQDILGYLPPAKESLSRYRKLFKPTKSGTIDHPQTYKLRIISEAQQRRSTPSKVLLQVIF
jgi:hypothetical protein